MAASSTGSSTYRRPPAAALCRYATPPSYSALSSVAGHSTNIKPDDVEAGSTAAKPSRTRLGTAG
jgi:hypothetical protein